MRQPLFDTNIIGLIFFKEKKRGWGKNVLEYIFFACVCDFESVYRDLIAKAKKKKSKPSSGTPVPNYNHIKPDTEFKIRPGSLLVGYGHKERSVIEMALRRVCREPDKGLEIYRSICMEMYNQSMALLEKVSTNEKSTYMYLPYFRLSASCYDAAPE